MSKVSAFLESVGREPLPAAEYDAKVDSLGVDAASRHALLARDAQGLSGLLGGREHMRCAIRVPE